MVHFSLRIIAVGQMFFLLIPVSGQELVGGDKWYTSDIHLHANGCRNNNRSSSEILQLMKDEGVNIGSALVWDQGTPLNRDAPKLRGQQDDPVSEENYILRWDVEISSLPGAWNGHMDLLNTSRTDIFIESNGNYIANYPGQDYLLPNYEYNQQGGGLVGYGHGQNWTAESFTNSTCCPQREFPLDVVLARVDFYATEFLDDGFMWFWYQMLDAGFQIPGLGTSDLGCVHNKAGAYTGDFYLADNEPLSYDGFIQAVSEGRTVVKRKSNLPDRDFLDIKVNGSRIGTEIWLSDELSSVQVEVMARSLSYGSKVELIHNGKVIGAQFINDSLTIYNWIVPISKSGWLAAKTISNQNVNAHTSSIFVLKEGCPIRNDPASAREWRDYLERYYEAGMAQGQFNTSASEVREKVDEAKAKWEAIAKEGEGTASMDCKPLDLQEKIVSQFPGMRREKKFLLDSKGIAIPFGKTNKYTGVEVYDLNGQLIKNDRTNENGTFNWNGLSQSLQPLRRGVYIAVLR